MNWSLTVMLWTKGSWELENSMEKSSPLLQISKSANISKGSNKSIKKGFKSKLRNIVKKRPTGLALGVILVRGLGRIQCKVRVFMNEVWWALSLNHRNPYLTKPIPLQFWTKATCLIVWWIYTVLYFVKQCFYLICAYQNKVIALKNNIYIKGSNSV